MSAPLRAPSTGVGPSAASNTASALTTAFEIDVDALGRDEPQPLVRDWVAYLEERWSSAVDSALATAMVAVVRGLLLDLLGTGDRSRTDEALRRLAELVEGPPRG